MADKPLVARIVEWLRAGYPDGVPQRDYVPLIALLRRQLTEDEVEEVSSELIAESAPETESTADTVTEVEVDPISRIDAGVKITHVTHELPHEADIARVREFLQGAGWPFDDTPLRPADPSTGHPDSSSGHRDPSSGYPDSSSGHREWPSGQSDPTEDQP